MADVQTETKTKTKTRGEGPIAVTFTDKAGKLDFARVPLDAAGVHIVAKSGAAKTYNVNELPPAVLLAFAALGVASRMKTYVSNHAEDNGSDAINLTDELYADFVAGKLYSRGEGTGTVGRKFDGAIYAQAWKAAYAFMERKKMSKADGSPIKALTEQQVLDLQASLEAMTPKDRGERMKSWKSQPFYTKALAELKAKAIKTDDAVMEDMPF